MLDHDEYQIDKFLAYRGDPLKRLSMQFLVRFQDGDEVWLPWSKDLFATVQYEAYCRSRSELSPLIYPERIASQRIKALDHSEILDVKPGDTVFVDLRSYGADWYSSLDLPNLHTSSYYVQYIYKNFNQRKTRIKCYAPVFNETFWVTNDFVTRYGSIFSMPADGILITDEFANRFPAIKPSLASLAVRYIYAVQKHFVLLRRPSQV
jgi:hypothetical protein